MNEWMTLVMKMREKHKCTLTQAMGFAKKVYKKKK